MHRTRVYHPLLTNHKEQVIMNKSSAKPIQAENGERFRNLTRMMGFLLAISFLLGCAATSKTETTIDQHQGIPPGSTLAIQVVPSANVAGKADAARAVTELSQQLFGRAMTSGRFSQVVAADHEADYLLAVELTGAREVSTVQRAFLGTLAGSNALTAKVELYRQEPRDLLKAFTAKATSAAFWGSSQNDMADAMRELVNEIENGLRS